MLGRISKQFEVSQGSNSAARNDWDFSFAAEFCGLSYVWADFSAVPIDIRVKHCRQGQMGARPYDVNGLLLGLFTPALGCHSPLPPVDRKDYPIGKLIAGLFEEFGVGQADGA